MEREREKPLTLISMGWVLYIYIYIRVRGFPLNGIFDPCAGCLLVAVRRGGCWLVVVRRRRHVPVPLWGVPRTQKSTNINNIHKIHAPNIQGHVFKVAEAPQAARTQTHRGGRL